MSYGLRYTITQKLRNGNNQVVEIYEKDYTAGVVKIYQPTSIILQPNSSVEYPSPSIISSQLNFSILLETQDDYDQFPNVLTQDDRKYYVLLKEGTTIMWRGFIFNDFSQMGYSTGITQADFVCVDGISFLQSIVYVKTRSINELTTHLDLISTALNKLLYPDNINLISACSYFAEGMVNRTDNVTNEPFTQIYQYVRDFIGESYYDIINNIMVSFNCRLFQANGDWWIASMNEMAGTTNYYTKYTLSPTPVLVTGGVLNNTINIQPYADGNVHFINNSQSKILKKGFYNIQGRGAYESALNYIDNANLKINDGVASAEGFVTAKTGTGNVYLITNTNQQFDEYFITSGTGTASIETGNALYPYLYIPYIGDIPYNLSFDTKAYNTVYLQVKLITAYGNVWLNSSNQWSSTTQNITIPQTTDGSYNNLSVSIPIYYDALYLPSLIPRMGYLQIKITTSNGSITVKNFILQRGSQKQNDIKYIEANYNSSISQDSTLKIFEQPYGNNYPSSFDYSSNKGVLCDSTGKYLKNWYSSTSTNFPSGSVDLVTFMTYQNIRNLNQNIATIECDLGSFKDSGVGYVYLDKVFTSTDSITGNLSYTGKKFIINRLSQNAYANEVNSVQLIEVSERVLDTFIIPTYITDIGQIGPFWFVNLNINIT